MIGTRDITQNVAVKIFTCKTKIKYNFFNWVKIRNSKLLLILNKKKCMYVCTYAFLCDHSNTVHISKNANVEKIISELTCSWGFTNFTPLYEIVNSISCGLLSLAFLSFLIDFLVDSVPLNSLMHVEPKYWNQYTVYQAISECNGIF